MTEYPELVFGQLYDFIINSPINQGMEELCAVSGFTSAGIMRNILEKNDVRLNVVIGMSCYSGIPEPDHIIYNELMNIYQSKFNCYYYIGSRPVHAKLYSWLKKDVPQIGILTSANLSWSGMNESEEAAVRVDPIETYSVYYNLLQQSISVNHPTVQTKIRLIKPEPRTIREIAFAHGTQMPNVENLPLTVKLPLVPARKEMHLESGLNWGQREGREPNQAYIPIPASIHKNYPGFFPPAGHRFIVYTDDGKSFTCVVAQQGNKAIETPDSNSILGVYFRERMGIPLGEFVSREDLINYGRLDVSFTKIDEDLYLLDFSKPK